MLPLLRRELLIDLHTQDCSIKQAPGAAWLQRPRPQPQQLASGCGRGAHSLEAALSSLRQASENGQRIGALLRIGARLTVADEYVDYLLVPGKQLGRPSAEAARLSAIHGFADLLGHEDSDVAVTQLPGSGDWLATAVDRQEHAAWRDVLQSHGVHLVQMHPALVEDLRDLAHLVSEPEAVLVFPREEGAMMLRLARNVPRHLRWVPLNPDESAIVELQVRDFARDTAPIRRGGRRAVVYIRSRSQAVCRYVLEPQPGGRAPPLGATWSTKSPLFA